MTHDDNDVRVYRLMVLENIATIAGTVALVLGAYGLGSGVSAMFGLLLLFNLNSPRRES